MIKRYFEYHGTYIAYKGKVDECELKGIVVLIINGISSGVLPQGGWWIVAKNEDL